MLFHLTSIGFLAKLKFVNHDFSKADVMISQIDIVSTVRVYCDLIDHVEEDDSAWLEQLAKLLPRLHAAVTELDRPTGDSSSYSPQHDLDDRFELFSRLHHLLGERDPYWMEFDVSSDGQVMSGSLADDLTDIFCELKYGLDMLDGHPEEATKTLTTWRNSYKAHWGQHLMDAQRHLYELDARNQLRF